MGNLNNKFSLTYFDARGRGKYSFIFYLESLFWWDTIVNAFFLAELSRMILAAAGVQFKDNRIQFKDWPAMKNSKFKLYFYVFN